MTDQGTDDNATDEQETEGFQGHGEAASALEEKPPEEKIEEIEKERAERLAPDNRPDNAEVDNTDAELPTVEEFAKLNADDDAEGAAGTADPTEAFRENPPSDEEAKEIEEERKRRLAPENRPENAEVDNSGDNMPDVAKD